MAITRQNATNLSAVLGIVETAASSAGWAVTRGPSTGVTSELWISKNGKHYILHASLLRGSLRERYFTKAYRETLEPNFNSNTRWADPNRHQMHVIAVIACDSFSGTDKYSQPGRTPDSTYTGYFPPNTAGAVTVLTFEDSITVLVKTSAFNYAILHIGDIVYTENTPSNGVMMTNFISRRVINVGVEGSVYSNQDQPSDWGWRADEYPYQYLQLNSKSLLGPPGSEGAVPGYYNSNWSDAAGYQKEMASRGGDADPDWSPLSISVYPEFITKDMVRFPTEASVGTNWCCEHLGGTSSAFQPVEPKPAVVGDVVRGHWIEDEWITGAHKVNMQRAVKDSSYWQTAYIAYDSSQYYRRCPAPYFGSLIAMHAGADHRKMLVPVTWFLFGDTTGTGPDNPDHTYNIGYLHQIRAVNPEGLTPEQVLEYGNERWLVIPDTVVNEKSGWIVNRSDSGRISKYRPWVAVRYQ